jgi:hypothetical protein
MSSDVVTKEARSLDEFEDWTDEVESRDEQVSERAIIGQLVRFTNEGQWMLPVYPVVRLSNRFMKTAYSGRLRPHFEIMGWRKFDPGGGGMIPVNDPRQLPPQQPANPPEAAKTSTEKIQAMLDVIGGEPVEPPSLKEEMKDEVPW